MTTGCVENFYKSRALIIDAKNDLVKREIFVLTIFQVSPMRYLPLRLPFK